MNNKKGMSCSGLIGAFVFVIVVIVVISMLFNKNKDMQVTNTNPSTTKSSQTSAPESVPNGDTFEGTTTEPEVTSELEETKYPVMNGFVVGDKKGVSDEYGCKVVGVLGNATGKNCSYVQVTIGFYNKNGSKVDSGIDNVLNLNAGETWQYEVYGLGSNISSFKIEEITWY